MKTTYNRVRVFYREIVLKHMYTSCNIIIYVIIGLLESHLLYLIDKYEYVYFVYNIFIYNLYIYIIVLSYMYVQIVCTVFVLMLPESNKRNKNPLT